MHTLYALVRDHALRSPALPLALEPARGLQLSYAEAVAACAAHRLQLQSLGLSAGNTIAFAGPPGIDFLVSFLTASRMGLVWMGLNPRHTAVEVEALLARARPRVLLLGHEARVAECAAAAHAARAAGVPTTTVAIEPAAAACDNDGASAAIDLQDTACLVFTSGTTGRPKAARLTHAGFLHAAQLYAQRYGGAPLRSLCNLPVSHVGCVVDIVSSTLATGGCLVFQGSFDPAEVGPLIEQCSVTAVGQVPTMWQLIAGEASFWGSDLSSLRHVVWSGAGMNERLVAQLAATGAALSTCYGMTEATGSVTFTLPGATVEELAHSIGHAAEPEQLRLHDDTGGVPPDGAVGEIQLRTPMLFAGYLDEHAATAACFTVDGWYRTGDLAVRRSDGALSLVGRRTEMFKSGGYNVYPREIEDLLETHPAVEQACVVGVPDPLWGEVGHAVLQLRQTPTATPTARELLDWARTRLARYKLPKTLAFADSLPTLPSGKVDRAALRAILAQGGTL